MSSIAEDLANRYTYHAPRPDQIEKYAVIRANVHSIAQEFVSLCPTSRELALALTHLEEAVFWANAAIARNE